ncbi:deoxynucleotidyltransferase terminal-interacting protein 2 [Bombina bombina]|uniref:deoxynucleotidyltransferase terminal-interacting protein 2 n=1 Tax=Bombina bombina TaxID=8345 RepID=UPI00235AE54C|nr:deoxynucleotidyltransferase terminal-interacting protein 2 [Bombina bombina]
MVTTRRNVRTDESEKEDESGNESEDSTVTEASASQVKTRSRMKKDSQSDDSKDNRYKDAASTTDHPELSDHQKLGISTITRSRRRSGQSDADISEAESNCSSHSTRMTRSRQALPYLTESARKLRNRTVLMAEPIMESKEDTELSETESNCSSVYIRSRRSTVTRSSRKSLMATEPASDNKEYVEVSEAESNCSSVSGVQNIRGSRSTRSSVRKTVCTISSLPPPVSESQKEEVSDAESCSSGISSNPIARRFSSRLRHKSEHEESEDGDKTNRDSSQKFDSPRKQRTHLRGVTVSEPLLSDNCGTEQKLLSSPCRNLRTRPIIVSDDATVVPADKKQNLEHNNEKLINDSNVEEVSDGQGLTLQREEDNLSDKGCIVESPAKLELQHIETSNIPKQIDNSEIEIKKLSSLGQLKDTVLQMKELIDVESQPIEAMEVDIQSLKSIKNTEATCILIDDSDSAVESANDLSKDKSGLISKPEHQIISLLDSDDSEESEDVDQEEEDDDQEEDDDDVIEVTQNENKEVFEHSEVNKQKPSNEQPEDSHRDLFVIDTVPGLDSSKKYYTDDKVNVESEDEENEVDEPLQPDDEEEDFIDEDEDLLNKPKPGFVLSTSINTGLNIKNLGGLYINFDAEKPNPGLNLLKKIREENKKKDEHLQKSIITPDFEKKESVPPYNESINKLKKQRREEKAKTTGQGWFDMKAPEMTDELKNDLKALKMRSAVDPKRFYKKNDRDGFPKYFQVGTVVDDPVDYYHARIPKKQRKRTIVEELLADSEFRRYNKKKYQEIIAEKAAIAEGKKNRKKKKFRK